MIKRFLKSIYTWIIIGTIAFLAFFYYLFSWTRTIDWMGNYPIDYEAFGTYGDFIGGVLGTLLSMVSVILVVVTFRHQQEQSKIERLNGIFFELLNLHNNQIEALYYQLLMDEPFSDTCVNGSQGTNGIYSIRNADTKDFFDCVIAEMFTKFKPTLNFYNNGVKAAKLYASNTLYVRSKLSLYYRTIYRILDTISNSDVDIKVKKEYFKLFRAQLTENELIALRYHVNDGRFITFANYINQSHLFKHLHLFSLLEFSVGQ